MDDQQLDPQRAKAVTNFAEAMVSAQAMLFVAIAKEKEKPAEYRTGGFKSEGPTVVDMAKALGALTVDLAQSIMSTAKSQGKDPDYDQAIDAIFEAIADGAEHARVRAGILTVKEGGDNGRGGSQTPDRGPTGPTGIVGPRGF